MELEYEIVENTQTTFLARATRGARRLAKGVAIAVALFGLTMACGGVIDFEWEGLLFGCSCAFPTVLLAVPLWAAGCGYFKMEFGSPRGSITVTDARGLARLLRGRVVIPRDKMHLAALEIEETTLVHRDYVYGDYRTEHARCRVWVATGEGDGISIYKGLLPDLARAIHSWISTKAGGE